MSLFYYSSLILYVYSPALNAGFLRQVRGTLVLWFLLLFLCKGGDKSLPCCLPCRRVLPFPWAFLHDLLSPIHPEVVPVLSQFPSQALYRYYQYCFHNSSLFCVRCHRTCYSTLFCFRRYSYLALLERFLSPLSVFCARYLC